MPNKKKLDFDVKRYLVAEVLYPDHVVPLHVGECRPSGFSTSSSMEPMCPMYDYGDF